MASSTAVVRRSISSSEIIGSHLLSVPYADSRQRRLRPVSQALRLSNRPRVTFSLRLRPSDGTGGLSSCCLRKGRPHMPPSWVPSDPMPALTSPRLAYATGLALILGAGGFPNPDG